MKARHISQLLLAGVAISLVYGTASSALAAGDAPDPFAAAGPIETLNLGDLAGTGVDTLALTSTIITTTASNESTTTTNVTIDTSGGDGGLTGGAGGDVIGGDVTFSGNALQNFGGVWTSAINTAPGGAATALTSMSITLNP